ncbi:LOW QUALITY PROTEIN: reverse transcriptase [Phytophthora megakarya]|uniref:Reverse transcriptase n=1 Tax=Phytophthora megakarya TaxID=4795 RepID=A0A225W5I9_9STRA|nr:LOW QUALITY PROTEIN: reverse transcriptase [Phytophthora megakarya]
MKTLPKIVKGTEDLPFPSTYKGVLSFLGSLNYYNKFIEDLPVVAAVLYKLDKERVRAGRNLEAAKESFEILKRKIVTIYWQSVDGVGVTLPHSREGSARNLVASGGFRPLIHGSEFPVVVYTRYSVLKWLLEFNTADGRHLKWGLELSRWTLEIHRSHKDEDGLATIFGYGITPWEHLDKVAETLIPDKGRLNVIPPVSLEMLDEDYQGYALSFDGAAKVSTRRGSCGCILWKLLGWQVVKTEGHILEGVTVNDAEYHDLILSLKLAMKLDVKELAAVVFASVKLIHLKREFNQAADYLTSKTLVLGESWGLDYTDELVHLRLVSRIPEKILKPSEIPDTLATDAVRTDQAELGIRNPDAGIPESRRAEALLVIAGARAEADIGSRTPVDRSGYRMHVREEEGPTKTRIHLSRKQVKKIAKVSDQFVLDSREFLYRLNAPTPERPRNKQSEFRLSLYVLTCYITHMKTFRVATKESIGRLSAYAQSSTGSGCMPTFRSSRGSVWIGRPPVLGPSPGNIEPRYPFEVVSMDFAIELPESERGNTYLLQFQDQFSGYVMCKPMRNTDTQDVAEAYEEYVFRRFGAISTINHDQHPRFMSKVFTRFRDLLKSMQRATLGYRPKANGQQERSVQPVLRSVRAYVAEDDQSDWDEHAERLMFALNTSFYAARLDTPFYLVHGWDTQGTLSAMLGQKPSTVQERTALE